MSMGQAGGISQQQIAQMIMGGMGGASAMGGLGGLGGLAMFSNPYTAILGGALMASPAIMGLFGGGQGGKQKQDASEIVNRWEAALKANKAAFEKSTKSLPETVAFRNRAEQFYENMMSELQGKQNEKATNAIKERQAGGKWDYKALYIEPIGNYLKAFGEDEVKAAEAENNPWGMREPYKPKPTQYFSDLQQPPSGGTGGEAFTASRKGSSNADIRRAAGNAFTGAPSGASGATQIGGQNVAFSGFPGSAGTAASSAAPGGSGGSGAGGFGVGNVMNRQNAMSLPLGVMAMSQMFGNRQVQPEQVPALYPEMRAFWSQYMQQNAGQGAEAYPGELTPDPSKMLLPKVVNSWTPEAPGQQDLSDLFAESRERHEQNLGFVKNIITNGLRPRNPAPTVNPFANYVQNNPHMKGLLGG